jgi:hypothetical protein
LDATDESKSMCRQYVGKISGKTAYTVPGGFPTDTAPRIGQAIGNGVPPCTVAPATCVGTF